MGEALAWWLVVTVTGAVTFPIAFAFFGWLPDRGYTFSRALGLLLVAYGVWMGATIGIVDNSRGAVLLALAVVAVAGVAVWTRRRAEIAAFLSDRLPYVLIVEGLFAAAFFIAVWLRAFVPEISGTEKPDEFAFLNAVMRADHFPVYDPWLSGFDLSYYYFGFVMFGSLIKVTGVDAAVGFNLAVAMVAALTVLVAFGVVYNLVADRGGMRKAVVFGLVGVVLVAILGNLVGLFELMSVHGIGSKGLFDWIGIDGVTADKTSARWYPDEYFWWWRSTRVPGGFDVKEWPFFSFLLGDLHPHVMVMPFSLLAAGLSFNFLRTPGRLDGRWALANPLPFLLAMLLVGALSFINAWSFPPSLALVAVVVIARNWREDRGDLRTVAVNSLQFIVPLAIGSVVLYAPYYWASRGGLWPMAPIEAAVSTGFPLGSMVTAPKHLFFSLGILLWLGTGLVIASLSWTWLRSLGVRAVYGFSLGVIPLAIWAVMAFADLGPSRFMDELELRDSNLITLGLLVAVLGLTTLAFVRNLSAKERDGDGLLLALGAFGVSVLVLLGVELFFQKDHHAGARTNTVFKLWHHTWLFLAIAGAFALYVVYERLTQRASSRRTAARRAAQTTTRRRRKTEALPPAWTRAAGFAWAGVAVLLIAAGLIYPLTATLSRTNDFRNPQTLDGLAFARAYGAAEYEAVTWLNANIQGNPVVLEAVGGPYSDGGRISARTGLPTVLEWPTHEIGFRGGAEPLGTREADVAAVYKTTSADEARSLLEKYEVEYVYVGPFERQTYGEEGLAKFGQFMRPVFQNTDVTIYKMPATAALAAAVAE